MLIFTLIFAFIPMSKNVFSLQSNIKITKTVEGNNIDTTKDFEFTIKIYDINGAESPNEYNYEKSNGETGKIK